MQKILIISGKPAEADKKVPPSSLYLVGIFDLLWILKPCYRRNFHSRASIEILFSFEKTPDTSSCPNNCKLKYFTNKLNVGTNIVHLSQILSELMQKRINIFLKYICYISESWRTRLQVYAFGKKWKFEYKNCFEDSLGKNFMSQKAYNLENIRLLVAFYRLIYIIRTQTNGPKP